MTFRTKVIASVAVLIIALVVVFHERKWFAACGAVPEADQAQYRVAADLSDQANKAMQARNYSTANDLLDMAASKLGDVYAVADTSLDDTGMILEGGKAEALRSEFQLAAQMKRDALNTRLSMFRRRLKMSARCHSVLGRIGL